MLRLRIDSIVNRTYKTLHIVYLNKIPTHYAITEYKPQVDPYLCHVYFIPVIVPYNMKENQIQNKQAETSVMQNER